MLAVKDAAKCWILSWDKFHRWWAEIKQAFALKMVFWEYNIYRGVAFCNKYLLKKKTP